MLSEDIVIISDGVWVTVPLITAKSIIYNKGPQEVTVRMGAASASGGIIIPIGQTVIVDETCYVRVKQTSGVYSSTLVVTR